MRTVRSSVLALALLALLALSASAAGTYALPDRTRTPGAVLTTDLKILCVSGYTKTVRPPASYTNALKLIQMKEYRRTGKPSDYEEDHLVPLELGGAPRDPKNLWPQLWPDARVKDRLENLLHARVCAKTMVVTDAQHCIASDWVACWRRLGRP